MEIEATCTVLLQINDVFFVPGKTYKFEKETLHDQKPVCVGRNPYDGLPIVRVIKGEATRYSVKAGCDTQFFFDEITAQEHDLLNFDLYFKEKQIC